MADVIVVNEQDKQIGLMPKSEAHRTGVLHRIAIVYVTNKNGEFLVQVRMNGRLDHSAAGHVDPGESYLDAAKRELSEELGIIGVELAKIGHGVSMNEPADDGEKRSHIFDIFVCEAEPGVLQPDEVKGVYWARVEDVLPDMQEHPEKYAGAFLISLPIFAASRK